MENRIDTIIILRNDFESDIKFGSESANYILAGGEVGIHYLDNGNIIVKAGDGKTKWIDLPQIESVLENDILLTRSFGKYNVTAGSFINAGGKDMTFSQWFQEALKETQNPTVVQPNATLSSGVVNSGAELEVGSYITQVKWDGSTSNGSYKVGNGADQGTGITSSNFTWKVTNDIDAQTSSLMDGTFDITSNKKQITSTATTSYGTIEAMVTIDPTNAKNPMNNLGENVPDLKIIGFDTAGTLTKKLSATISVNGFHKPFWAVKAASADLLPIPDYTSNDVRSLANSANSTKGFPSSLAVPAGSQQVVFFARAGAYKSLTATDDKAMNAGVTFTKVSNALKVTGNNGYCPAGTDGFDYDAWYVDWGAGIGSDKQLTLKWA